MSKSLGSLVNPFFFHIYIEKAALENTMTKRLTAKYPNSRIIYINSYKEVFCRRNQSFNMQKYASSLIIALADKDCIYQGARMCQSFGNEHFYYTSPVMNCIYDCEYCFLSGFYMSAYITVFVNTEAVFNQVRQLLTRHPVYLCVSYSTDLLAVENIFGYCKEWIEFAANNKNIRIEIRTKSANYNAIRELKPTDNVILAWTLSPSEIISAYEKHTPTLASRLSAIKQAAADGWKVRLCFDPIIYCDDWETVYGRLIKETFAEIDAQNIYDISTGVFRVSSDEYKAMKKQNPYSVITRYPYIKHNGAYSYEPEKSKQLLDFIITNISMYCSKEIFIWNQ